MKTCLPTFVKPPISSGIDPVSLFPPKLNSRRLFIEPMLAGTLPEKSFDDKSRNFKFSTVKISFVINPVNLLLEISTCTRVRMLPTVFGIVPMRKLKLKSTSTFSVVKKNDRKMVRD